MTSQLHAALAAAAKRSALPKVIAYNRVDGPGSSLDLPDLQEALWTMRVPPPEWEADPQASWSKGLPRTVGMTIDTGTMIEAHPLQPGMIGVRSVEYGTECVGVPGEVVPLKENWLLKILDVFGLDGAMFVLHNLRPGTHSAGLGGSATATAGVCVLANELVGRPFSPIQLIALASRLEHGYHVSLTGTQEQSNVLYGGVVDYVWFPWGVPGAPETEFGTSARFTLIPADAYPDLQARMAIFHSGVTRPSTDVNAAWLAALRTDEGYRLHRQQLGVAYAFREALRLRAWDAVAEAITEYRATRTQLCPVYMGGAYEIEGFAVAHRSTCFPLGAGGGGGILVFSPDPERLVALRNVLGAVYREIPFHFRARGHELVNLPLEKE